MSEVLTAVLDAIASWPGARWLQGSDTAYVFVNTAHILGLGLLLGAIVPLDLRLAGLWRQVPLPVLVPFLTRAAALGLALAVAMGLWLFSVRPHDYVINPAFQCKAGLLLLALGNIVWQHGSPALARSLHTGTVCTGVRLRAIASMLLWLAVLLAGRWIGFL
jgi:hypothetical protein